MINRLASLSRSQLGFSQQFGVLGAAPAAIGTVAMMAIPATPALVALQHQVFCMAYAQAQSALMRPRHERLFLASWN